GVDDNWEMSACLIVVKTIASRLTYRRQAEFILDLAVFVAAAPEQRTERTEFRHRHSLPKKEIV
ncbi:MAG: hypothetical protein ACK46J_15945, partial [Burkholderiales bacterium]